MSFQERLRIFFKSSGLTITEIAQRMGYTKGSMNHYLGEREPNMAFFLKLIEVFPEVDLNHLIKGIEKVYPRVDEPGAVYEIEDNVEKDSDPIQLVEEISLKLEQLKTKMSQK